MSRWLVVSLAALALVATGVRAEKEIGVAIHEDGWHRGPVPMDSLLRGALAADTVWWVQSLRGPGTPAARVAPSLVPRLRAILLRADSEGDGYHLPKVCRTLPADSVVQRYEWHPRPDSLPRDGAPRDEANPKFGQYVYVEELPEAVVKVPPEYPDEARKLGVDGTVVVQALVDRNGHVADTRVTKSVRPLDDAAAAAVRQWKFKPATTKGNPVAVWVAIPIKFSLH